MLAFKLKKKGIDVEKDVHQCTAAIQIILVQQLCERAKRKGKIREETGLLALAYGIALLFLKLEREEKGGKLDKETVLKQKEQIIIVNLDYAFGKEVTSSQTEGFSRLIYEVLKRTKCDGDTKEEAVVERIGEQLNEAVSLENAEWVTGLVKTLQRYLNMDLNKKLKATAT